MTQFLTFGFLQHCRTFRTSHESVVSCTGLTSPELCPKASRVHIYVSQYAITAKMHTVLVTLQ